MEPSDSDKHLNLTTVPRSDVNPMMPAASWVVSGGLRTHGGGPVFIAVEQHRHALRQEQRCQEVAFLSLA